MIPKNLNDITEADFLDLINNSVPEGRTIEYKRDLPGNSDKDKKEFLADVSSFANASGGDLLYGIDAKDGIPISVNGLEIDSDKEILRLEAIIRSGIEPRIPFVIQPIRLSNSKFVLVIRVNKSWISPHRVVFQSNDKFYSRGSNGKYSLSVDELRIAFNFSETITERIRKFRETRIANIVANETPISLMDGDVPIVILHLIPINSFNPSQVYDLNKIEQKVKLLQPLNTNGWNSRYNADGILNYDCFRSHQEARSYIQFFRNGIIESVWKQTSSLLMETPQKLLNGIGIEEEINKTTKNWIKFLNDLDVGLPIFIFLTLVNVKGFSIYRDPGYHYFENSINTIDRDILILPEATIDKYDIPISKILKPCFDSMWNAGNFPGSPNYNEHGQWQPRR